MSPRTAVEEQQEARRAQLIGATLAEVAEKGFSDVTLEGIALRAGLSKGVALYYFQSKEHLFLSAFEAIITRLLERLQASVDAAPGAIEKIRNLVHAVFVGPKENCNFYRTYLDFMSLATRHPDFQKLNTKLYRGFQALDRGIVELGIREGVFRVDADAGVVCALFDGLLLQWLFDQPATFGDYRARCEQALLSYLKR